MGVPGGWEFSFERGAHEGRLPHTTPRLLESPENPRTQSTLFSQLASFARASIDLNPKLKLPPTAHSLPRERAMTLASTICPRARGCHEQVHTHAGRHVHDASGHRIKTHPLAKNGASERDSTQRLPPVLLSLLRERAMPAASATSPGARFGVGQVYASRHHSALAPPASPPQSSRLSTPDRFRCCVSAQCAMPDFAHQKVQTR